MKRIKNDSLQAFFIYLNTDEGIKDRWLQPRESIVVPDEYITQQLKNLHNRRLIKIINE